MSEEWMVQCPYCGQELDLPSREEAIRAGVQHSRICPEVEK